MKGIKFNPIDLQIEEIKEAIKELHEELKLIKKEGRKMLKIQLNQLFYGGYKVLNVRIGILTQSYEDFENGVDLQDPYETYNLYNIIKYGDCFISCEQDKRFVVPAIEVIPTYIEFMRLKENE